MTKQHNYIYLISTALLLGIFIIIFTTLTIFIFISPPSPSDGDKNDMLTAEEYSVFHRRLLKIAVASLENASSFKEDSTAAEEEVEEMSEGEIDELMKQDFKADAGEDGAVSKEEFRFAVFEV